VDDVDDALLADGLFDRVPPDLPDLPDFNDDLVDLDEDFVDLLREFTIRESFVTPLLLPPLFLLVSKSFVDFLCLTEDFLEDFLREDFFEEDFFLDGPATDVDDADSPGGPIVIAVGNAENVLGLLLAERAREDDGMTGPTVM